MNLVPRFYRGFYERPPSIKRPALRYIDGTFSSQFRHKTIYGTGIVKNHNRIQVFRNMNTIRDQCVHILCGLRSVSVNPICNTLPYLPFPCVLKVIQAFYIIADRIINRPALLPSCFHKEAGYFSHLIENAFSILRLVLSSQKHNFPYHTNMIISTEDAAVYDIVKQLGRLVIQQLSHFFFIHDTPSSLFIL